MDKKQCNFNEMERLAKKVEFLDNPERRGDIPPKKLIKKLPVKKTDSILDLGAGTGYFTIPFAKTVEGPVYALDIDLDMLEIIKKKAIEENITNVKSIKGCIDDLPLSDNSIDLVFASLVLHEVQQLSTSLQQIKRVLKDNGYFICIEFEKKDNQPHNHPRITSSAMEQELIKAGLAVTEKLTPTDAIYMIIARK
ncbi:class I SAM-dependent methyltransferase [Siminovitchia fortis]|uniref:Methyltransferase domain-containing protein n=2 Tax=Bacillales TaxID=1385 RepID=A0A443IIW1_9BACI|nr:methyltransferase domain-containing protein [Siminovitchia fortis]RWR04200.1 methyltransferase domain-containing protein [Siminovitchia fortis]WHY82571.1 methyltransferase domain-containing protein [Siminovitchia fortis]